MCVSYLYIYIYIYVLCIYNVFLTKKGLNITHLLHLLFSIYLIKQIMPKLQDIWERFYLKTVHGI